MKRVLVSFFVVFCAAVFLSGMFCNDAAAAEKVIEIKIASPFSNSVTNGYTPEWIGNEMRRRGLAGGKLDVKIYSNAQLGGEMELINKLKAGAIHLTINSFQVMSGFDDKAVLGALPFLIDTDQKAEKFLTSKEVDEVSKSLESQGLKNLGYLRFGCFTIAGRKPIKTPDDLKGMKVRIAESPIQLAIFKALGLEASPMPWVEVYEALKRGVVDGLDMGMEPIWGTKMDEVVKYLTQTSHVHGMNFIFTNKKWFEGLPADVQEFIQDTVQDIAFLERNLITRREQQAVREFKRKGIEILPMTAEEKLPFIKLGIPVHKQYLDKIGRDLVERTYKLLDFPFAKEVLGN
jgi:tripartite ATP-independent transporter DctP family solute receptor